MISFEEAKELLDEWIDTYDSIIEEEQTLSALGMRQNFQSGYIEDLEESLELLEPRMGRRLISLAQQGWSLMRIAHTMTDDDRDYNLAQTAYATYRERLNEWIPPLLESVPGPANEKYVPPPGVTTDYGTGDDLPF